MSNWMAIAAVTDTLRNLFIEGFNGFTVPGIGSINVRVTNQPPDKTNVGDDDSQINLFLYHISPNAAWRNSDMPRQVQPGETGQAPLALNLYYLLSAYGRGNDNPEPVSQHILGRAMHILHDHPVLSRERIKDALADSNLHQQIERVRISLQPLSLEEMFNLWSAFQTQYRISVAYQVTVVLIESSRTTRTPPPVLARNTPDDSTAAQPEVAPFPVLSAVALPEGQLSATTGDEILLMGSNLSGTNPQVEFSNALLGVRETVIPTNASATRWSLVLPAALATWPAGFSRVAVSVERNGKRISSNELPMGIAPEISVAPLNGTAGSDLTLTISCTTDLLPTQRVSLLFGDSEIVAAPRVAAVNSLDFTIPAVAAGTYIVRLRVDGVDSQPFVRTGTPPQLVFAANQKVVIA